MTDKELIDLVVELANTTFASIDEEWTPKRVLKEVKRPCLSTSWLAGLDRNDFDGENTGLLLEKWNDLPLYFRLGILMMGAALDDSDPLGITLSCDFDNDDI